MNKDNPCVANSCKLRCLEWMLLTAVFLLAGTVGHDPWKQDETYSFGIIYNFFTAHTWLIPTNAGMPFMEKPPLYYWSATLFCKMFSGVLPLHDAARLTSVAYMLGTALFTWKLSDTLFESHPDHKAMGWMSLALLLGCVGLVRHAHDMFTDVALLTGTTITMYGMALLVMREQCWKWAGFWLGLGIGIAFMSKGFLTPAILTLSGLLLLCLLSSLRRTQTFGAILIALVVASPFLFIWPLLLYQQSTALFMQWVWENNVGRFLGFSVHHLGADNKPYFMLYSSLWFAFPVLPLACVTLYCKRGQWRTPQYLLPLSIAAIGMGLLLASASARALYLIPLLPALTLLAIQAFEYLPAAFLYGWNMLVRTVAGIGAVLIWVIWWSLLHPADAQPIPALSKLIAPWLPIGFVPTGSQFIPYAMAGILMVLWLASLRFESRTPKATARIWFTGIAVLWGLSHTLLLPWINETKSYRSVLESMNSYIKEHTPYANDCIGSYDLGESISPMLQYFGTRHTPAPMQDFNGTTCPMILADTSKEAPLELNPHWKMVWRGARVLDTKDKELRLYIRKNP